MIQYRFALLWVLVPGLSVIVAACDITTYECKEGAVCEGPPEQTADVCGAFCDRLATCDRIDADHVPACRDHCRSAMESDAETTEAGCQCVLDSNCGGIDHCDGAPLPNDNDDDGDGDSSGSGAAGSGSGGASSGSGGTSGSGGETGTPCTVDCDCPSGQSCDAGFCVEASQP